MFQPKKYKFTKIHKKKVVNQYRKNRSLMLSNSYGLKSLSYIIFDFKILEVLRRFMSKISGRKGRLYRFFTLTLPLTKKAEKSRMGKGVGKIRNWYTLIRPGQPLYELRAVTYIDNFYINKKFIYIKKKLPFNIQLLKNKYDYLLSRNFRASFIVKKLNYVIVEK
jgi:ribosomal protein L16